METDRDLRDQKKDFSFDQITPKSPWMFSPIRTPPPSLFYNCIASLNRGDGNVYAIALSEGVMFTGSDTNCIRAWKQPYCIEQGYIRARSSQVRSVLAFGNTLFSAHKDHKIRVWNFSIYENFQYRKVATLPKKSTLLNVFPKSNTRQHKDYVCCMAFCHVNGLLYTGSFDRTVKVWRLLDNKCVDSFVAHEDRVTSIVINQDDGCIFTSSFDGSIRLWRILYTESLHTLTMTLRFRQSPINALALSSNSLGNCCFLYSGSSDGTISFWEKERFSGRFKHEGILQGHHSAVLCLVATERLVFSGSDDATIRVWKRQEGNCCYHECLGVLDGHRGPVRCLAASIEREEVMEMGILVYSASMDQTVKVWRVKVASEEDNGRRHDLKTKIMDCEMCPVLSPSWVEKKLNNRS